MDRATFSIANVEYVVVRPNPTVVAQSERVSRRAFQLAVSRACPREKDVEARMRASGTWSDAHDVRSKALKATVAAGGDTPELRRELVDLWRERSSENNKTVEGQALNAQFDYIVSRCLLCAATNKPVFSSLDDYRSRRTESFAYEGASLLAQMLFGLKDWPETR
jgi:hypothetical protein